MVAKPLALLLLLGLMGAAESHRGRGGKRHKSVGPGQENRNKNWCKFESARYAGEPLKTLKDVEKEDCWNNCLGMQERCQGTSMEYKKFFLDFFSSATPHCHLHAKMDKRRIRHDPHERNKVFLKGPCNPKPKRAPKRKEYPKPEPEAKPEPKPEPGKRQWKPEAKPQAKPEPKPRTKPRSGAKAKSTKPASWSRPAAVQTFAGRLTKKCFTKIGCFEIGKAPYNRRGPQGQPEQLPEDPIKTLGLTLSFYDRKHFAKPLSRSKEVKDAGFDKNKEMKVIVHGFWENPDMRWIMEMRRRYLRLGDHNVLVVGWPNHVRRDALGMVAAADCRVVAAWLYRYLNTLLEVPAGKIHCIGHNMGAHICGDLGKRMGRINRITGLDPKGSPFDKYGPEQRLDSTDAWYVDVIHTDMYRLKNGRLYGGFGTAKPMGHVDFYPNGGWNQPGCAFRQKDYVWRQHTQNCDSARAAYFFMYSMYLGNQDCNYRAIPCKSHTDFLNGKCTTCAPHGCMRMGEFAWTDIPSNYTGKSITYYLKTGIRNVRPGADTTECLEPYVLRTGEPTGTLGARARGIGVQLFGPRGQTEQMVMKEMKESNLLFSSVKPGNRPRSLTLTRHWAKHPRQIELVFFKAREKRVVMKLQSELRQPENVVYAP